MKLRVPFLTLAFAGAQMAVYLAWTHLLLDVADHYHAPSDYSVPLINAVWLVLLFPLGIVGEFLPHRFMGAVLGYGLPAANALLWGWCITRFLLFALRRRIRPSSA